MFFVIANVLNTDELEDARVKASALEWRDGAATAGPVAKRVKRNLQANTGTATGKALTGKLKQAVLASQVFQAAARPAKLSPLLISRTSGGGGYGAHVDNAIMGEGGGRMRTDLSFTLFLSSPDDYEGGALAMDMPGGVQRIKPAAGDLVLYPSTLIHEVEPVTEGERLAAVGWVQSDVREQERRQILFDLEQVRMAQRASTAAEAPERLVLDKAISNLLRLWATP